MEIGSGSGQHGVVFQKRFPRITWQTSDPELVHRKSIISWIESENLTKIFDPFYSNKKDGAGLGLNIVKSLVEQNKGRISFSNNARGGSDFIVHLPMSNIEKAKGNDNIN